MIVFRFAPSFRPGLRRSLWLLFTGLALLAALSARAQNTYPPPAGYAAPVMLPTTGGTIQAIATADVGPNLFSAAVVSVTSNNQLNLYRNTRARSFLPPLSYATGPNPVAIAAGNFRGVGSNDIAVAQAGNNTVRLFLSNRDDATLGAFHDYASGGQTPRELVVADEGIFVVNADNIAYLQKTNNFGATDPAAVFYPPQTVTTRANVRDLVYFDFDGQSVEIIDPLTGQYSIVFNGPDFCFVTEDNKVVIGRGSVTIQVGFEEPIGRLFKMRDFLCVHLPQSNRVARLAFGARPEMNGTVVPIERAMPSGRTLSQAVTLNFFDLPPGTSAVTSRLVDVNFDEDLVATLPGTNALAYFLNPTSSSLPAPTTVPLGLAATRIATGVCDNFDLNYDFAVLGSNGELGVAFSGNPPIYVTTGVDEDNGTTDPAQGTGTSLREALNRAATQSLPATIQIATTAPLTVSQVAENDATLGSSAFVISGNVTIRPPDAFAGGIAYAGSVFERSSLAGEMRLFRVAPGARLSLARSTFRNWLTGAKAGAVIYSAGELVIDKCTFQNNSTSAGGCVAATGGSVQATNSTFTTSSGALRITGGTAVLTHLTMAYLSDVAPLYIRNADVTLVNSLVASYPTVGVDGTLNAASHHNLIAPTVPNLGGLSQNGGQTPTILLLPGCPAINAGAVVAGITEDQRGFPRNIGAPDIGAFEFTNFVESLVVTTDADEDNGTSDPGFGAGTSLREAVAYARTRAGDDAITFSAAFFNVQRTITLTLGEIELSSTDDSYIEINGPAAGLTLDGNNASRIFNVLGGATLRRLTLTRGSAGAFGASRSGGAILNQSALTIEECTFTANFAPNDGYGGALQNQGYMEMTNCTFVGNSAGSAGAIDNRGAAFVTHITVTGNTGTQFGTGGVRAEGQGLQIFNSIITGNTGTTSANVQGDVGAAGSLINSANPQLGPLASNGGPTQTIALLSGSPAVNLGIAGVGPATDQRGVTRTGNPDAGAYELVGVNESLVVTTAVDEANGTSDPRFGTGTSLREAVAYAATLAGPQTITFAPALAGQNMQLLFSEDSASALRISGAVTIRGQASGAGITLLADQAHGARRHFQVQASGSLTLEDLTLRGGRSATAGGSINSAGQLAVARCTFTDNNSAQDGGAIHAGGTSLAVTNSTFAGNSASSDAAAIAAHATACTLQNVTIIDNTAGLGAALSSRSPALLLRNTLVARNTIQGAIESNVSLGQGGVMNPASSHNLFGPGAAVNGGPGSLYDIASAQLRVGALGSNGGATQTAALLADSPARDAGTATGAPATDQRGKLRPQFGVVDIGAVELTAFETGQTIVSAGGASWYLGPNAAGNDLRVYREVAGEVPVWVDNGLAARIGQAGDGTVLVRTASGLVFSRPGSTSGVGSHWQQLTSVFASDGATWFLGPDGNGSDAFLYRWAANGSPVYSGGAGSQLFVLGDGTILTRTAAGQYFQRLGSNAGIGTNWELLPGSLVVTTAADEDNGTSAPQLGTGTSLREALAYAQSLGGAPTITFAPALHGQTVTLTEGATGASDDTALRNGSDLTIDGGPGVTIHLASAVPRRHFLHGGGTLNLRNLTLSGGDIRGVNDGGVLYNTATVAITNVRFTNNRANHGGAVLNLGTMTIENSTFDNNATATGGQGGAIWSNGTLGISGSTFHLNTASVLGGAVASFNGLTVANCNFSTNHSDFNGGALRLDGSANVSASTFSNNSAVNGGGAIMSHGATTLTNVTVAYNVALDGGGIQFFDGTASVRHATLAYNSATRFGGGIAVNLADVTLKNTLAAGNAEAASLGSLNPASSNNLLNLTDTQAGLGAFANHGGPYATLALLAGSPAINAGANIAGVTTDQRGLARTVGSAPDIGALEDATGEDDPDRDSLSNFAELQLGTNPLGLDTDGDGFNDATETLNNSDPKLATSVPAATRIERVLGFGPARGLDLSGTFRYAFNVGTTGAAGQAGDANFTADDAPGITVGATGEIANFTAPDFGSATADEVLESVYRSIRWANHLDGNPALRTLRVDLANLVPGRQYKLQLLFGEAGSAERTFDVLVEGTLLADNFRPADAQGAAWLTRAGSALVHTFTAGDPVLNIVLDGANVPSVPGLNADPYLNGVTMEEIPTVAPAPLISPTPGIYTGSVAVSIATAAQGATIRYTTDGSAPSETIGTIYTGSFSLTASATVRAITVGGGWLPSPISTASYTVQTALEAWRALHGLAADGSQDRANPSGDGVANLLKYAFNLAPNAGDLLTPNIAVLAENGTAGMPFIDRDAQGRLVIEFIRRKAATQPGISYVVETGDDLTALQPLDLSGANTDSIDTNWERVTVTDPTITPNRFGRVRVTVP